MPVNSDIFHSPSSLRPGAMLALVGSATANEAAAAIRFGAKVFDVRTSFRHGADGLPGSASLPLEQIEAGAVPDEVGPDETFFLVCEVGGFSELAAAYLRSAGLAGARSVRGGLAALRPLLGDRSAER